MKARKDPSDQAQPNAAAPVPAPSSPPSPREMNSGRVAFDARGNAVWEWRTGDGEFQRDASTTIVRKLEPQGLAIEATGILKRPGLNAAAKAAEPTAGALAESAPPPLAIKEASGGDPYNSGRSASHVRAAATQRPAPRKNVKTTAPAPRKGAKPAAPAPQGILGRLLGRR
ncbi:MAG: hypothetical protein U1F09_09830 [Steroidobacteraceae bacterium]